MSRAPVLGVEPLPQFYRRVPEQRPNFSSGSVRADNKWGIRKSTRARQLPNGVTETKSTLKVTKSRERYGSAGRPSNLPTCTSGKRSRHDAEYAAAAIDPRAPRA